MNNTVKTIFERKSVRSFENKVLSKEQLELIVKAGMAAPSARNLQPWAFIIITDRNTLNTLADRLPYAKMLYEATAAIVVCGIPEKSGDSPEGYWVQDCSAATQNILLAIESMGLGAVWTGVYPRSERIDVVRDVLSIPQNVFPLNVIPIGYPKGENRPKDKFKPENIRREKW
ncbi:MAG TPA: nitroreductase family protein [Tenuifilaceae bacterium]|nr:nitroreductase family protein [Tenuifilaceae bacterium]HPI44499.1 nitroreductase family protein [Tenuifilaceae bacterium]